MAGYSVGSLVIFSLLSVSVNAQFFNFPSATLVKKVSQEKKIQRIEKAIESIPARAEDLRLEADQVARRGPPVIEDALSTIRGTARDVLAGAATLARRPSFGQRRVNARPDPVDTNARPVEASSRPGVVDLRPVDTSSRFRPGASSFRPSPALQESRDEGRVSAGRAREEEQFQPTPVEQDHRGGAGALFAARGNAQTFSPGQNPLNDRERPQVQDLRETPEFIEASRQPLAQDFLPTCPDATFSYIIPSPSQCDLYYLCEFGTPTRQVCDDGMVFSIDEVKCVSSQIEHCEGRPLLQAPQGTGACERRNGIFYTNETCKEFVTCRDNHPSFEMCAEGLVFDPKQKICAWADEALRPGCLPEDLLGFRCPNPKLTQEQALLARVHLRFGDHDRHSDPKDCRFFFMCLTTGQPRRAGCGQGKVFDGRTGICKAAKDVPECADYYGPSAQASSPTAAEQAVDSRLVRIQDDISRQFQQENRRLRLRKKRWMLEAEPEPEY